MEQYRVNIFVDSVVKDMLSLISPSKVILFNLKNNLKGEPSAFKLCVIIDCKDKFEVEKDIYINVDCDIPYDVIIYTNEEYEKLKNTEGTFANKIHKTGKILYE